MNTIQVVLHDFEMACHLLSIPFIDSFTFIHSHKHKITHTSLHLFLLLLPLSSFLFLLPKTRWITQRFQHHTRACASHSPSKTPISPPASSTRHPSPSNLPYKKHLSILLIMHQLIHHILPITPTPLPLPTSGNRYGSFEYPIEAIDWNDKFRWFRLPDRVRSAFSSSSSSSGSSTSRVLSERLITFSCVFPIFCSNSSTCSFSTHSCTSFSNAQGTSGLESRRMYIDAIS